MIFVGSDHKAGFLIKKHSVTNRGFINFIVILVSLIWFARTRKKENPIHGIFLWRRKRDPPNTIPNARNLCVLVVCDYLIFSFVPVLCRCRGRGGGSSWRCLAGAGPALRLRDFTDAPGTAASPTAGPRQLHPSLRSTHTSTRIRPSGLRYGCRLMRS